MTFVLLAAPLFLWGIFHRMSRSGIVCESVGHTWRPKHGPGDAMACEWCGRRR